MFPFNSLWPSKARWWHRSQSTLAQVMACCLMAPSHCLKLCWHVSSKVHLHSSEGDFITYCSHQLPKVAWKLPKISFKYPRDQWFNSYIYYASSDADICHWIELASVYKMILCPFSQYWLQNLHEKKHWIRTPSRVKFPNQDIAPKVIICYISTILIWRVMS